MSYLEELLPEFRQGVKIRCDYWDEGKYIQLKEDGYIYDDEDDRIELSSLVIFGKSWEFYKEPETDWDYIIKNKCLCWFSNSDNSANIFGYLQEYNHKHFVDIKFNLWEHCRPVRRDEVTFYEDKKDE